MVEEYKELVRKALKQLRKELPYEQQYLVSSQICQRIINSNMYRNSKHIAFYYPANGEVDLCALWRTACGHGKYCYFPKMVANRLLEFYWATPQCKFVANQVNILEPVVTQDAEPVALQQLDLILMPLLAFDSQGNRLGMGAGYYDRTLAPFRYDWLNRPRLIGVAYEFQHRDALTRYAWDVPLDGVMTEHHFYKIEQ